MVKNNKGRKSIMNIRRIINYIISPEGAALAGMIVATPALIAAFFGVHVAIDYFSTNVVFRLFLFWFGFMLLGFVPGNLLMTIINPKYSGHRITLIALILGITLSLFGWII